MRCLVLHHCPKDVAAFARHFAFAACRTTHPGGWWDILIRWGNTDGPDADRTLNRAAAVNTAKNSDEVAQLLRANGLRFRSTDVEDDQTYRIHVVDLSVIAITRKGRDGRFRRVLTMNPRRQRLLQFLSRRAVYILGLHFAAVDIRFDLKQKPAVIRIDPAPALSESELALYAEALLRTAKTLYTDTHTHPHVRDGEIIMGADPEFILQQKHTNRLRFASDYFPAEGPVGYDARSVRVNRNWQYPIAEIRPRPSAFPSELVAEIRRTLRHANQLAPDRNTLWLAGACPHPKFPIGGHIHFSRIQLTTDLLEALDNYLALPMMLLENPDAARRRRPRYGYLGDFRRKDHGGFEYRTLSSWLTGVRRARATLSLAKLIVLEYPRLTRRIFTTAEIQQAFYQGDQSLLRPHFQSLWNDICATTSYRRFEREIAPIEEWIVARRRWRERVDLRRRWEVF